MNPNPPNPAAPFESKDNDFVIRQFWSTHLFLRKWKLHSQHVDGIIDCLYQLKSQESKNIASGVAVSAKAEQGLFESDFDLFQVQDPGLQKLKQFLIETIQEVVSKINGQKFAPQQIAVEIDDGWFHITNEGGFHDVHGHQQCSWCGIYYLQLGDYTPPDGRHAPNGGNRFYSPYQLGGRYIDYGNKYLDLAYLDPPIEEGLLLLFPSYLQHSALPYRGQQDRIVIAFNSKSNVASH